MCKSATYSEKLCCGPEQLEKTGCCWALCGVRYKPQQIQVIATIKYGWTMVYIQRILSHADYDEKEWQK